MRGQGVTEGCASGTDRMEQRAALDCSTVRTLKRNRFWTTEVIKFRGECTTVHRMTHSRALELDAVDDNAMLVSFACTRKREGGDIAGAGRALHQDGNGQH